MNIVQVYAHPDHWQKGRQGLIDSIGMHIMSGTLAGTDGWFSISCAKRTALNALGADWFKMSHIQQDEYANVLIRDKKPLAAPSSAHYGVGRDGAVHQYVRDEDTAYHAGPVSNPIAWKLHNPRINNNARSIGIEHEGTVGHDGKLALFAPESQIETSAALVAMLCKKWSIVCDRDHIFRHGDVDPARRSHCPPLDFPLDEIILRAQASLVLSLT